MKKEMSVAVDDVLYDIYYLEKNPSRGFNFPCILGIPSNGDMSGELIVECNNDEHSKIEQEYKQHALQHTPLVFLKGVNAPMLIPLLPGGEDMPYFQQLSRSNR